MYSKRIYLVALLLGFILRELVQLAGLGTIHGLSAMWVGFLIPVASVAVGDILVAVWRVCVGTVKEVVDLWRASLSTWAKLGLAGGAGVWLMKEILVGGGSPPMGVLEAWGFAIVEVALAGVVFLLMAGICRAMYGHPILTRAAR